MIDRHIYHRTGETFCRCSLGVVNRLAAEGVKRAGSRFNIRASALVAHTIVDGGEVTTLNR